jgi:hypothetical protein
MLEPQIQNGGTSLNISGTLRVRVAVETETVKLDGALALTVTVAGTEQVAPAGAPVQVNDAVPDMPAPPMASIYEAVAPAATQAAGVRVASSTLAENLHRRALQLVSTLGPARALGDPRVLQFQQNQLQKHLRQFLVGGNFANLECALVASPGEKLPFVRSSCGSAIVPSLVSSRSLVHSRKMKNVLRRETAARESSCGSSCGNG